MKPTKNRPLDISHLPTSQTGKVKVLSKKRGRMIEVDITPEHTPEEMRKNIGMSNDGGGGVHV